MTWAEIPSHFESLEGAARFTIDDNPDLVLLHHIGKPTLGALVPKTMAASQGLLKPSSVCEERP